MSEMHEVRVRRDGDAPLVFRGEQLATATTHEHEGDAQNRWHEITVYRTAAGRFVLAIKYHTQWQGERDCADAVVLGDQAQEVTELLRHYDGILPTGIGFPPGEQYAARQARLEASIEGRWHRAVSEILEAIGAEERIE